MGYSIKRKALRLGLLVGLWMGLCASVGLWLYSSDFFYRKFEPLAVAINGPGVMAQACSQKGTLHLLLMQSSSNKWPAMHFERQTYMGNGGYPYGYGASFGGLVLRVMPYRGGSRCCIIPPFAALVIPYWLTFAGFGFLILHYSGWLRKLKPYLRVSRHSRPFTIATALIILGLNAYPFMTHHNGVLRIYGLPQFCLRLAVQNGEILDRFLGYKLGWDQIKLMENLLAAVVLVLAVNTFCEYRHQKARYGMQHDASPDSDDSPSPAGDDDSHRSDA
jgi:hypothetical protein